MKRLATSFIWVFSVLTSVAQDIQISFQSDTLTLNGTLSIPIGTGPFPTVVFVHGSGPNDRDQTLHLTGGNAQCLYPGIYNDTIRNFKDLAAALSDFGVAALRYDKRTFTYQTELDPKEISPYDFIADVHAAIEYLKTRPEVDTNCIILLGHSQGANFIPIVAQQRTDISTLLALGTAARGIDTILAMQLRDLYYICLNDTVTGDTIYNQTLSDFQQIRNGTWNPNTPYFGAYPAFWKEWINITDSAIINFNAVSQPTLFLQGTEDFNIPVEDAQRYESQLTIDLFDVYYLNGINHFFTTSTASQVAQIVSDTIFYWLNNNKFTATTSKRKGKFKNEFFTYPNPTTGLITLTNLPQEATKITVYNVLGKQVYEVELVGQQIIDISYLPAGMYMLRIDQRETILRMKVIKL